MACLPRTRSLVAYINNKLYGSPSPAAVPAAESVYNGSMLVDNKIKKGMLRTFCRLGTMSVGCSPCPLPHYRAADSCALSSVRRSLGWVGVSIIHEFQIA